MDLGRMDRLITIQTPTASVSNEGGVTKAWSTGYQVWAEVIQKGGRESFRHQQVISDADIIFRIFFNATVVPDRTQRVVYNSTSYNIMDVRELGYGERWEIMAKAEPVL